VWHLQLQRLQSLFPFELICNYIRVIEKYPKKEFRDFAKTILAIE